MVARIIAVILLNTITALSAAPTKIDCLIHRHPGIYYMSDNLLGKNKGYINISSIIDCAGYCVDKNIICKGVTYNTKRNTCTLHGSNLNSSPTSKKYEKKPEMVHASVNCAVIETSQQLTLSSNKTFNQNQKTPLIASGRSKHQEAKQSPKPSDNISRPPPTPNHVESTSPTKNPSPPSVADGQPNSTPQNQMDQISESDRSEPSDDFPFPIPDVRFPDIGSSYFTVEVTSTADGVDDYLMRYRKLTDPLPSSIRLTSSSQNRAVHGAKVRGLDVDTIYAVGLAVTINETEIGFWSEFITTLCGKPRQSPQNVLASIRSPNTIRLQWEEPPRSSWKCSRIGFVIKYKSSSEFSEVAVDPYETSYDFPTEPNKLWEFQMSAQAINDNDNKGESSFWSNGVEIITPDYDSGYADVPVAPTAVVVEVGTNSAQLEWDSVAEHVRGYVIIYRSVNDVGYKQSGKMAQHVANRKTNSRKLMALEFDTAYKIQIKVVDHSNRLGKPNSKIEIRTICEHPTVSPSNIELKIAPDSQWKSSWKAPSPDTWRCSKIRYEIEFENSLNNISYIELPLETTEYTFLPSPDADWTSVRIRTKNTAGWSLWTRDVRIPGSIKNLGGVPLARDAIFVKWDFPNPTISDMVAYIISYAMISVGDCPIAHDKQRVMVKVVSLKSAELIDLAAWATYEIKVRAIFGKIKGPDSKPITVQTVGSSASGPPINIEVNVLSDSEAKVTWEKPACLDRNGAIDKYEYALEGVDSNDGGTPEWKEVAAEYVVLSQLSPSLVYNFMLRTVNSYHESIEISTDATKFKSPGDFKTEALTPNEIAISFLPSTSPEGTANIKYYIIYKVVGNQHQWSDGSEMNHESCPGLSTSNELLCFQATELEPSSYYVFQVLSITPSDDISAWSGYYYQSTLEPDVRIPLARPITDPSEEQHSVSVYWHHFDHTKVKAWDLLYNVEGTEEWIKSEHVTEEYANFHRVKYKVGNLEEDTTYLFRFRVQLDENTSTLSRIAMGRTARGTRTEPSANHETTSA